MRHARFRPVRWAANRPASTVQVDFEAEAGLLGFSGQGQLRIFGPSNEKYAIRGGCDQLPTRLSAQLQGQIELGQQLVAVRQGGGTVTLDEVVLAVPFSILRSSVDFSGAGFRPLKQTAIRELGMGTNSKLHVQFTDRHWEGLGCNGETFADTGYQTPGTSPASEPPRNCSRPNLSATLPCPAPGRRDRRRGDEHRAANAAACLSTAL